MGNDKGGGFETYDLDGTLVQRLAFGSQFWGNVDVRQGVTVNGDHPRPDRRRAAGRRPLLHRRPRHPVAVLGDRGRRSDRGQRRGLLHVPEPDHAEGLRHLHHHPGHRQPVRADRRRRRRLAGEHHGAHLLRGVRGRGLCRRRRHRCALHQRGGRGAVALRRRARAAGTTARRRSTCSTSAGGHLVNDIEGVTIVDQPDGAGFIFVSAQNVSDPNDVVLHRLPAQRRQRVRQELPGRRRGRTPTTATGPTASRPSTADLGPAYPGACSSARTTTTTLPGTSATRT